MFAFILKTNISDGTVCSRVTWIAMTYRFSITNITIAMVATRNTVTGTSNQRFTVFPQDSIYTTAFITTDFIETLSSITRV